jgi:uncharacterized protein YjiS (DUF1127 family)
MQLVSIVHAGGRIFRDSSSREYTAMIAIHIRLASPWSAVTTGLCRETAARWFDRACLLVRERLGVGDRSDRELELNDHLLKDVGVERSDLEYETAFWPIWRPSPACRR